MNIFRRLPLQRLLLLCALVVVLGVSLTALAFAVGAGPTPPPRSLADAVREALAGAQRDPVAGVSASITLTDHLLEGANLASGGNDGQLTSNPLVTGASGRLWASDGRVRLELQSQQGDTQIVYDGHTLTIYDAASNTLYRVPQAAKALSDEGASQQQQQQQPEAPSVAKIEEAISRLSEHANVSGATPTDVAGRGAYTVRVSPKEGGSLLGGFELSFDAANGVPLRAAVYSTTTSAPVVELAAQEISYGPVSASVFELNPPSNARVEELRVVEHRSAERRHRAGGPRTTTYGHGPGTIVVLQQRAGKGAGGDLEGLPKVDIDGVSAAELRTELGTVLSFARDGVSYLVAGAVEAPAVEAVARGL